VRRKVHRNLNKGLWSVVGPSGRVEEWVGRTLLTGVTFLVQPGGWRRARREGRRNVHARACGRRLARWRLIPRSAVRVRYNLGTGRFEDKMGREWKGAKEAWFDTDGKMYCTREAVCKSTRRLRPSGPASRK
jgi:hypothetical protein